MGITHTEPVKFEHSTPIFRIDDMERSLRFYVEEMGFQNADWGSGDFTCVTRDGAGIYLCLQDQGRGGAWAWIGVDDVRRLREELVAKGVCILLEPANYPWALEMQVEDPDGNVIRFGSEPEPGS